jgi:hypothetical protein
MRTSYHPARTVMVAAFAAMVSVLAGCASMDASNERSLLSAAGFRARTPETAQQKSLYASAEPYKMLRATKDGKVVYAYKDEKHGVCYVGGESEYQRYQKLAVEQRIAQDNYVAAEMQRDLAWGWYGAWGPGIVRPYFAGPRPVVPGFAR